MEAFFFKCYIAAHNNTPWYSDLYEMLNTVNVIFQIPALPAADSPGIGMRV